MESGILGYNESIQKTEQDQKNFIFHPSKKIGDSYVCRNNQSMNSDLKGSYQSLMFHKRSV